MRHRTTNYLVLQQWTCKRDNVLQLLYLEILVLLVTHGSSFDSEYQNETTQTGKMCKII